VPLTQGIIDTAALPQVNALERSLTLPTALTNPHSGTGALTPFGGGMAAYAIQWSVFDSPSSAGRSSRSINIFQDEWLALTLRILLSDASDVVAKTVLTRESGGLFLFDFAVPFVIDYSILPGWQANFAWLVAP